MIGIKNGNIELFDHHPKWLKMAQEMIVSLKPYVQKETVFEHIGSTSIPSIKANPTIDIAVGVTSLKDAVSIQKTLEEKGFQYILSNNDDILMCFHKYHEHTSTTYHLHVLFKDNQYFKNLIYFREYLKNHSRVAKEYEDFNIRLASKYPDKGSLYTEEKKRMIQHINRKAQVHHFLGQEVTITIDRPIGAVHPKHPDLIYPINYGYINNEFAPDNEELDVYLLDVDTPVSTFFGKIIAIIHRENDIEDKLVMSSSKKIYSALEIKKITNFQEQYYVSTIELIKN